jgi:hypothetical protein
MNKIKTNCNEHKMLKFKNSMAKFVKKTWIFQSRERVSSRLSLPGDKVALKNEKLP